MALRLSKERFFTELLDTSVPGLAGIDRVYREEGAEAAERRFAEFVRASLPAEAYFRDDRVYLENAWFKDGETPLEIGERILRHQLMSVWVMHDFGADRPVDWTANPTFNNYAEWTWQLSRHHEWRHLARLYRMYGDERYVLGMMELAHSYIEQTECPENASGFATKCWRTIEIGIRLANNWPYMILAIYRSPSVTDAFLTEFFMSLWENAWRLRHFSTSHNWLIMEMNGLLHTALLFPFYRDAAEWKSFALRRLIEELDGQFYPDHFQFEMTTSYHGVVLMNYFGILRIAHRMGVALSDEFYDKLRQGFLMYIQLRQPDGRTPALNDGGRTSVVEQMEVASEFFAEDPLFRWFLSEGKEGSAPDYTSLFMPYSGMAIMRSGWGSEDSFAMLECAPFGRAHQHEDKLQVLLYAFGRELLSDYGGYAYDTSDMRKYILSSYSHNTAIVDGMQQARHVGYTWHEGDIRRKEKLSYRETDRSVAATGVYDDGYGEEKLPLVHTRSLIWFKQGLGSIASPFYLVLDSFRPEDGGVHTCEMLWHAPRDLPYEMKGNAVTYRYGDGVSLRILGESAPRVLIGQNAPYMCGWKPIHAIGDHEHQPVPTTVFTLRAQGEARCVTLLLPSSGEPLPIASVRLDGGCVRIGLDGGGEECLRLSEHLPDLPNN